MNVRPHHLLFALMVHALVAALLLTGVECTHKMAQPPTVEGTIINIAPKPVAPPQPEVKPEPKKPEPPTQNPNDQKAKQAQEQQRQDAEARERSALEQQRQQELQHQQQIAKEKAQQEEQRRAQELQRQADEEEAARKQAEESKRKADEAKRKAEEAERKKKEAAAKQAAAERRQRELDLAAAVGAEEQEQAQTQWAQQITAAISRAWTRMAGTDNLKCILKIRLAASGAVLDAQVAHSSGNQLFDDSVQRAVYKASPLPLPTDMSAFDPNINICFSPDPRNCQ
jgi:colicin import membrane protein